jgi:iron complex outermembrane receptor protein
LSGAAAIAIGLAATPARAQAPAPAPSGEVVGLAEVIVTAQRREENLQRAGIAVTAVTSDTLDRAGVADASGLTNLVPALQVSNTFGPTTNFYLRGVGNFVTNSFTDPAIAFNVDGVIFQRPTAAQASFFDLERIEVLKGPQGTLYGRNATGGAINLITVRPKLGEYSGFGNAEFGNYATFNANGAVNIPIGDKTALRVAAQSRNHSGYYSDGTGDEELYAVRAQLLYEPSSALRVLVAADYAHQGGAGSGTSQGGLDPNDFIGAYDPRAQALYSRTYSFIAGDFLRPMVNQNHTDNALWGVRAEVTLDTPVGALTVLPAFRRFDLDYQNGGAGFQTIVKERTDQKTLEVRLASNGESRFGYLLGAYYFDETPAMRSNYNQQYFAAHLNTDFETESWATFGRFTYRLTDTFRVNAGIRYTEDQKSAVSDSITPLVLCLPIGSTCFGGGVLPVQLSAPSFVFAPNGSIIPFQPSPAPVGPDGSFIQTGRISFDTTRQFTATTWRAGVEWDVAPRSLFYATYETGYKSGGFHGSLDGAWFEPETIKAYTIGLKNRLLDNRVQLNLELFDWTYEDQQVSHFRTNSRGDAEFVTENIGVSSLRGAEVELIARVAPDTTLNMTAQYLDAKYDDFVYNNPASFQPTTGCKVTGAYTVNCSGFRPPQSPEWTVMLGAEHVFRLGAKGAFTVNLDTRYQSETYTGLELLPSQIQDAFWLTNAQVTYRPEDERFSIAAFVNNIEDKGIVGFSSPHPQAPTLIQQNLRAPRTYGVRLGVNF